MGLTSIGDMAQSLMLKRQNTAAKTDLQRLAMMLTSGKVADASSHLRGNLGPLAGIDVSLARIEGYREVTAEASRTGAAMQAVFDLVDRAASGLGPSLLTLAQGGAVSGLTGAGSQAVDALGQVVGAMNTRLADRSLLSGVAGDRPALVDAETLLDQAAAAVASAIGAAGVEGALQAWLDDPAGFAAQAYMGGDPKAPLQVAEGEVARLDVTANDPALRATLKGILMGALLGRGVLAGQRAEQADLARRAGESLAETAPDRAHLAARVGIAEQRIAAAQVRNAAEASALTLARNEMVGVDGYDTATALQETQTRLETLYTLTARLSRLKLADYL